MIHHHHLIHLVLGFVSDLAFVSVLTFGFVSDLAFVSVLLSFVLAFVARGFLSFLTGASDGFLLSVMAASACESTSERNSPGAALF